MITLPNSVLLQERLLLKLYFVAPACKEGCFCVNCVVLLGYLYQVQIQMLQS